jgi:Alpha/beta hydrolase domain
MLPNVRGAFRTPFQVATLAAAVLIAWTPPIEARVTRIIIDSTTPLTGQTVPYEQLRGRAFGELDPNDAHNQIITDVQLGKDADGKVRYEATFVVTKPVDMSNASGFMWHDVPNRAGAITIVAAERNLGDIGLASAWQADNAGATAIPANHTTGTSHWVAVPMAKNADGSLVTGSVLGRIVNRSGVASQPLNVMGNPIPYLPTTLDTSQATLTTHTHETYTGVITQGPTIASADWAFAHCDATNPFPGTPDNIDTAALPGNLPVHICLKNGFDPTLLYQVVYQAKGAYLLGAGMAAFRDVGSFFRYAAADDFGTANPIAGKVRWEVIRGVSQSGNYTRQFIHQGFNQDEANRIVHEGAWPIIAGRRIASNTRWGQTDGVPELYQLSGEGPQWWTDFPDAIRGYPSSSVLDRCNLNGTCPKIIEHSGGSEIFALRLAMEWTGSAGTVDIPVPPNVRRYYVPSSTHGGGGGGFNENIANTPVNCPGNNWGPGTFRANPVPETELVNRLRVAMRDWVMVGTLPPPSSYPTVAATTLVDATKASMGFPSAVPGVPDSIFLPQNFVNQTLDYDWGPQFNAIDLTGVPANQPPPIVHVIPLKVPKVDADGNELGGVPTVLRDAPLGTYLGWNITASGFHAAQVCNYVGGMIPFAHTRAERLLTGDTRLSLEERYGSHAGYVLAVKNAAGNAWTKGYLLPQDMISLVGQAQASNVCTHGASGQSCDPAAP